MLGHSALFFSLQPELPCSADEHHHANHPRCLYCCKYRQNPKQFASHCIGIYQNCEWCEVPLGIDDQALEGKCSYCHYKWEKIKEELLDYHSLDDSGLGIYLA